MRKPKSILVIEDDVELCLLISELLTKEGFHVTVRHDGKGGLKMAKSGLLFDLILLDLMLPTMDGFEFLEQFRMTHVTPVIMLTAKDERHERLLSLEIGADDFIAKPFDSMELLARINAVFRRVSFGHNIGTQTELRNGKFTLDMNSNALLSDGIKVRLTGTEFSILQLLWINIGSAVSKEDICENIFNRELKPYDRTIDMHISNLRKKFSDHAGVECIVTVRGCGYQMIAL